MCFFIKKIKIEIRDVRAYYVQSVFKLGQNWAPFYEKCWLSSQELEHFKSKELLKNSTWVLIAPILFYKQQPLVKLQFQTCTTIP